MNIYDPSPMWLQLIEIFLFGFHFSYYWSKTTQIFKKRCHKHFERTLTIEPLALAPYILIQVAFPFSYSNTSMCNDFFSLKSLFEIDICRTLWKRKKNVSRYISTSLRMYQDQARLLTNHSWQAWKSIYNNQNVDF